jgi:hypothetical protein
VTTWQISVAETSLTYSPVGLRLLDELTDDAPLGKTTAYLDIRDASGVWRQTDIPAVRTPSGVVSYPGLERHTEVIFFVPQHYRVRISADLYVPLYQANSDGIEFDAYPYNDATPLPKNRIVRLPQDLFLTPAPNYPFQGHIPVLRGIVIDPAKNPVPNALVTQGPIERVVTDSRGTFALPLRWAAQNVPIPIDAVDNRTHRLGSIPVTLPGDLAMSHTIPIS